MAGIRWGGPPSAVMGVARVCKHPWARAQPRGPSDDTAPPAAVTTR